MDWAAHGCGSWVLTEFGEGNRERLGWLGSAHMNTCEMKAGKIYRGSVALLAIVFVSVFSSVAKAAQFVYGADQRKPRSLPLHDCYWQALLFFLVSTISIYTSQLCLSVGGVKLMWELHVGP